MASRILACSLWELLLFMDFECWFVVPCAIWLSIGLIVAFLVEFGFGCV